MLEHCENTSLIPKTVDNKEIRNKIYEVRGLPVMLDSDLAKLFNVETGNLNKAMKRNTERFPIEFFVKLNEL